ncbi:MAG TPA: hypothetical protein VG797_04725 [Phycisphaerales bacterium]|nr:hypothetical protein [Phycisphaerales bacterium]
MVSTHSAQGFRSGGWLVSFAVVGAAAVASSALAQNGFVNFESPSVHPVEITPDGTKLIVCNTADDRVEVFDITGSWPVRVGAVPVGIDPVSVRARTNNEVWVVNKLSDSVCVVSLATMNVVASPAVGDEPCDVVFAGSPLRAFVSVAERNQVKVLDPLNPNGAQATVAIQGENPRALATDGTRVYAAIFESGNHTSIIPREVVSDPASPSSGQNPPFNDGAAYFPPLAGGIGLPPPAALIVKKFGAQWLDDNGVNWSSRVGWDLHDHDAAIIDANTLAVTYASGLMTINMAIGVNPASGVVTVVGTDATNDIRFEPNLTGTFVRVHAAMFDPSIPTNSVVADLNPHLTYTTSTIPQAQRNESIGDPRAIVWNGAGDRGYVSGMGSNNVLVLDSVFNRVARIDVGAGPTGLAVDGAHSRLYVLNRFDATISVIDTASNAELGRVSFFDPTPASIKSGRPFLYDTHRFSGLGQIACASCHVDGRMDQISWDLGNPAGAVASISQPCANGLLPPPFVGQPCIQYHPMKGPMATQTLQSIVQDGVMHWRGDRADLAAFAPAFMSLQGDDVQPTPAEMQQFTDFVATLRFPPNPNRTITDLLPTSVTGFPGNPINGGGVFGRPNTVGNVRSCVLCHAGPTGTNAAIMPANFVGEPQTLKVPHLRNLYQKAGFNRGTTNGGAGFGMLHDGSDETIPQYLGNPIFTFPPGPPGQNDRRDLEAFLMCFPTGTHPATGVQLTVDGFNNGTQPVVDLFNTMLQISGGPQPPVSIIAKGLVNGVQRGWAYTGGNIFQSERQGETIGAIALRDLATAGNQITFTVVPRGTEIRAGIDRDSDGFFDRTELESCSNPDDASVVPGGPGSGPTGDADHNLTVGIGDVALVIQHWGQSVQSLTNGDVSGNGAVGLDDIAIIIQNWGHTCP